MKSWGLGENYRAGTALALWLEMATWNVGFGPEAEVGLRGPMAHAKGNKYNEGPSDIRRVPVSFLCLPGSSGSLTSLCEQKLLGVETCWTSTKDQRNRQPGTPLRTNCGPMCHPDTARDSSLHSCPAPKMKSKLSALPSCLSPLIPPFIPCILSWCCLLVSC